LNQDIATLQYTTNTDAVQKQQKLQQEVTAKENMIQSLNQQMLSMTADVDNKNKAILEKEQKVKAQQSLMADNLRLLDSLKKEVKTLRARAETGNADINRLDTEINRLKAVNLEKERTIMDQQAILSANTSGMDAVRLQNDLDNERSKHKHTIEPLSGDVQRAEAQLQQVKQQTNQVWEHAKSKMKEIEEMYQQQINDLGNSMEDSELQRLRDLLKDVQKENARHVANRRQAWKKLLNKKEAEIEALEKQIRAADSTEWDLKRELTYHKKTGKHPNSPTGEELQDNLFKGTPAERQEQVKLYSDRNQELVSQIEFLQEERDILKAKVTEWEVDQAMMDQGRIQDEEGPDMDDDQEDDPMDGSKPAKKSRKIKKLRGGRRA
jgi:chromosome segregation ATPase